MENPIISFIKCTLRLPEKLLVKLNFFFEVLPFKVYRYIRKHILRKNNLKIAILSHLNRNGSLENPLLYICIINQKHISQ